MTAQDLTIYVDGKRKYTTSGDFSKLEKPFYVDAHSGDLTVKSVEVVK